MCRQIQQKALVGILLIGKYKSASQELHLQFHNGEEGLLGLDVPIAKNPEGKTI